jgi:uncharacterized protein YjiS (DUF1127 family)
MVTTTLSQEPASLGERLFNAAFGVAARLAQVWQAARNRRAVAKLLQWDSRMLRDIGLTQGDVAAVMALPRSVDPSRRLRFLSVERRAAVRADAAERLARAGRRAGRRRGLDFES